MHNVGLCRGVLRTGIKFNVYRWMGQCRYILSLRLGQSCIKRVTKG